MNDKVFIDTNVLVYAYDYSEPEKQLKALELIDSLVTVGNAFISTQILSEFFVVVTKKITTPLTLEQAEERVNNFCQIWPVLQINPMVVLEAVRGVKSHKFSFWDGLVWGAARLNQISTVLSEDFSHDSYIEGVLFRNPFL